MSATVIERIVLIRALTRPDRHETTGYQAHCDACNWTGPMHAVGYEPAPNAEALFDAAEHDRAAHR